MQTIYCRAQHWKSYAIVTATAILRGAHASRVLIFASCENELFFSSMSKAEKLFGKLMSGQKDANFSFDDLSLRSSNGRALWRMATHLRKPRARFNSR
jgi:hypothetical protein